MPLWPTMLCWFRSCSKGCLFKFYACSAIDALVHATESYVSPKSNPYTRLYCRAAIEIIIDVFQGIAANGPEYRFERLGGYADGK